MQSIVHANLTQSEVPDDYVMMVPPYAEINGQMRHLGLIRVIGNRTLNDIQLKLPVKPRKVVLNAWHDILEQ
jgi:hypothetical protein